ncbi:hypothetical protein BJF85_15510 [Saccharomonospora sp. CUA-673]|uniref:hypothetical protein n=1 Tax=Saccharomonospora sp. CUA-673 TaxID=1904969 RepID=UPI0009684491|nr:hypothetical protein [Saccharomonospora sp. CUA-673]OLT47574.1 hypothetical protein BJF85_15510 [Saccharomonospora sp. CUA-673]
MKTPVKLGTYVVAVAAAAALAFGVGSAVGPVAQETGTHHGEDQDAAAEHGTHTEGQDSDPGGLQVSEHGYTLQLETTTFDPGTRTVEFRITGPDGRPVTDFEPTHEKKLHLVAVNRDTSGFQHVHPQLDDSGTWRADLDLTPGSWRLFADFHPSGHNGSGPMTLGVDAAVRGNHDPQPLPDPDRTARVGDYTVRLDGDLVPGETGELSLSVHRDGEPVTDLQPYLGAYGHLVALRAGDLGYLHVHPEGEPGDGTTEPGPDITFAATAPSAGAYRLFLDFRHENTVRTAAFTVHTGADDAPGRSTDDHTGNHDHGHG